MAGGKGHRTSVVDPRLIQHWNQTAEVLFGKQHKAEPNFVAPLPYPESYKTPEEEELLGIEYAQCQSARFMSRDYYVNQGLYLSDNI